jgi:hypothetical protein
MTTEQQVPAQAQVQQIDNNRIAIPATIKCPACGESYHMVIDLGVNGLAPTPEQQLDNAGFTEVPQDGASDGAVVGSVA